MEPYKPQAKIMEMGDAIQIEIPMRPKTATNWVVWLIFKVVLLMLWFSTSHHLFLVMKMLPRDKFVLFLVARDAALQVIVTLVLTGIWRL